MLVGKVFDIIPQPSLGDEKQSDETWPLYWMSALWALRTWPHLILFRIKTQPTFWFVFRLSSNTKTTENADENRRKRRPWKTVPKKVSYVVVSISVFGRFSVDNRQKRKWWKQTRWKIFKTLFLLSEYQGSDGLDGVESLITNVGGRLLMLQKDKAYPERKYKKVSVMWISLCQTLDP